MELNLSTRNGNEALVVNTEEDEKINLGQGENGLNESISSNGRNKNVVCNLIKACLIVGLLAAVVATATVTVLSTVILINKIQKMEERIKALEVTQSVMPTSSEVTGVQSQLSDLRTRLASSVKAFANHSYLELRNHLADLRAILYNSTVDRYVGCYEERRECSISPTREDIYYRGCQTPQLLANISNYRTLSIRCELNSNLDRVLESSQIMALYSKVHCECGIVNIESDSPDAHGPLHREISATCAIIMMRCPNITTLIMT